MPLSAIADAVSDFYKGKTVKIVIGGSMGGAYSLMHSFCPAMSIDIYPVALLLLFSRCPAVVVTRR
jgi:hypothetical protein